MQSFGSYGVDCDFGRVGVTGVDYIWSGFIAEAFVCFVKNFVGPVAICASRVKSQTYQARCRKIGQMKTCGQTGFEVLETFGKS